MQIYSFGADLLGGDAGGRALGGNGYLAGENGEAAVDGRARVLNVPARIDITVLEPITFAVVARTWSRPDGTWQVPYLDTARQFMVIGTDRSRQVNSAIQDRVTPAPMPAADAVVLPWIEMRLPPAGLGRPWRGDVLLRNAIEPWQSPVITGIPAWMTVSIHDTGIVLRGIPDVEGPVELSVTAEVGGAVMSAAGQFIVANLLWYGVKIVVTAVNGDPSWLSIGELSTLDSAGDQVGIGPGGLVASSSQYDNSTYSAERAFDGDAVSYWCTAQSALPTLAAPQWLSYVFATPVAVAKVGIIAGDVNGVARLPRNFEIHKQVASGDWVMVAAFVNVTDWNRSAWKVFPV